MIIVWEERPGVSVLVWKRARQRQEPCPCVAFSCGIPAPLRSLKADECLERVQRAFDTRQDGGRRSPETEEQVMFVEEYVKSLKQ